MATILNADTLVGGAVITGDASGQLELQAAGVTKLTVASGGVTLATPLAVASGGTGGSATPTAGGIVYGTGTVQAVSAAGTSGQLLQSNGASAPTWVAAPSSAMTLLSTVTISNSATADVETTFNSTYDTYMIVGKINTTTGANPTLHCRLKIGGSYVTADYPYHTDVSNSGSVSYAGIAAAAASEIVMTRGLAADASYSVDFVMYVQKPTSTTEEKAVFWTGRYRRLTGDLEKSFGQGAYTGSTAALTGVRFFTSTGNLVSGYVRLYGIAKS